jgi:serine/threonine protein kinase
VLDKRDLMQRGEIQATIQERNILRDLDFPFIVSYVGSFQDTTHVYIVMEFVVGGELFLHLKYSGKFGNEKAKFYAAELVLFFEYLHGRNYVYRDLKPENVLLDSMGHIKVVDFGFAKHILKRTTSFCGTPEYIAPEMILRLPYDYSVDIWSLGVLIHEMLTGSPPYTGRNPKEVYRKILYGKLDLPTSLDPAARDLLKRLLQPTANERLACGKKALDELKRHKWFKGLDWERLKRRDVAPPYVPPSSYEGDSRNFLSFDSTLTIESESTDDSIDQSLFDDF